MCWRAWLWASPWALLPLPHSPHLASSNDLTDSASAGMSFTYLLGVNNLKWAKPFITWRLFEDAGPDLFAVYWAEGRSRPSHSKCCKPSANSFLFGIPASSFAARAV